MFRVECVVFRVECLVSRGRESAQLRAARLHLAAHPLLEESLVQEFDPLRMGIRLTDKPLSQNLGLSVESRNPRL